MVQVVLWRCLNAGKVFREVINRKILVLVNDELHDSYYILELVES